jgi:hypothetical protein
VNTTHFLTLYSKCLKLLVLGVTVHLQARYVWLVLWIAGREPIKDAEKKERRAEARREWAGLTDRETKRQAPLIATSSPRAAQSPQGLKRQHQPVVSNFVLSSSLGAENDETGQDQTRLRLISASTGKET